MVHASRTLLVTVIPAPDPSLVTGTGFAGGVMSADEAERLLESEKQTADDVLDDAARRLGISDAEKVVLSGDAGPQLCELAASLPADVVVLGSHGRGGVRRVVMGSVSDHVVRHAGCPVLVRGPA